MAKVVKRKNRWKLKSREVEGEVLGPWGHDIDREDMLMFSKFV